MSNVIIYQQIGEIADMLNYRKNMPLVAVFMVHCGIFRRIFQQRISNYKAKQYGKIKFKARYS